jgi:hypothetical protein
LIDAKPGAPAILLVDPIFPGEDLEPDELLIHSAPPAYALELASRWT